MHELVSGPHGYPEQTQLMVARVGNQLLGTVPAEITTTAGDRMKKAMQREARRLGVAADSFAIVSLTNGYLQYITTAEEYSAQRYEGGATIFGPGSAAAFERLLIGLVQTLADDSSSETSKALVDSIVAHPGKHKTIFPSATSGPPPADITRAIQGQACREGTLVVSWIDAYPGRLVPADGPVLRIDREVEPGTWQPTVWDDDPRLEVRAIRAKGKRGYLWEARWIPDRASGNHRVVLLARKDLPEVTGQVFQACR
jgi:neutral ceramidase